MERIWKRGDIGPDGRRFWKRAKTYAGGIRWVSEQEFEALKQKTLEQGRAHAARDPERRARVVKAWKEANPEKVKAGWTKWYAENAEMVRENRRSRALANPENEREIARRWRRRNPKKVVAQVRLYRARAKAKGPEFEMLERLRGRIRTAFGRVLPNSEKPSRAKDRVSVGFLVWLAKKKGIEDDLRGMQIDHILPVWWWRAHKTSEEFKNINAPENVRWLTSFENASKAGRLPSDEEINNHLALVAEWRNSFPRKEN